jgi:hypothetical protein
MKRIAWILATFVVVCLVMPSTALALGAVDVDVKVMYWLGELEIEGEGGDDMDGVGLDLDLWFTKRFGATVLYYPTSGGGMLDGLDADYLSLDLKWKVYAPEGGSYVAVGAGYQDNELKDFGDSLDTSGFRVFVDGAVEFNDFIQGYASYVFLPSLDSLDEGFVDDGDGSEYELGVRFNVAMVDLYAGYRAHNMSFDIMFGGPTIDIDNDGFVAGVGFRF